MWISLHELAVVFTFPSHPLAWLYRDERLSTWATAWEITSAFSDRRQHDRPGSRLIHSRKRNHQTLDRDWASEGEAQEAGKLGHRNKNTRSIAKQYLKKIFSISPINFLLSSSFSSGSAPPTVKQI